jgi:hypothetical protein
MRMSHVNVQTTFYTPLDAPPPYTCHAIYVFVVTIPLSGGVLSSSKPDFLKRLV